MLDPEMAAAYAAATVTIDENGHERLAEMNKGVTPLFFSRPAKNDRKSAEAGRPIYDSQEFVRLFVAGDPYNQGEAPVDDRIKERFPDQYDAWVKKKQGLTISGTPLRQWPGLDTVQVAELEALKIFSVEALAQVAETSVQKAQGLRELRARAQAYLEQAKDGSTVLRLAEENQGLKADLAAARQQLDELAAQVRDLAGKRK